MIREYMNSLFTLPLAAWIWRPCASRFPFSREIWQVILRFVGQPSTAGSNTTGPAQILTSGLVFQQHNAGRLLVLDLLGKSMACVCWQVQHQGYYDFAPVAGRQQTRAWNADRGVPDRDEAGGLRRWHCTTVENGLRIMRDGRMRVLPGRVNYPQGIYSAKSPANTYDIGCQVGLRVAGVIASKAVGRSLAHSREMCPLGLIVVLDRSVEEWIVHPDGCEIVEIRFHYEMLRTYLEQTPLASRMLMPRMPGVLQRR